MYRFEVLRPGYGTAQGGHYYEIEIYPHPLAAALRSAGLQHSGRLRRLNRQQFRSARLCQQFCKLRCFRRGPARFHHPGRHLRPEPRNSIFSITGTAAAFEPCLGWGPGVSGCSLKSVIAAASLLQWAENARLASRTPEAVQEAFYSWYDTLDADEQESFAEAWTMIEPDALSLLSDKDSMAGRIEDAGLDPDTLPGCTLKNWQALQTVLDDCVPAVGQ